MNKLVCSGVGKVISEENSVHRFSLVILCALLHVVLGISPEAQAISDMLSVRQWSAPDHTRIVFDLSHPAGYDIFELREPYRLVIDLNDTRSQAMEKELIISDEVISKVRWGQFAPTTLRVVIDLVQPTRSNIFTLKEFQDKPSRLVVDVFRPDLETREKEKRSVLREGTRGTYVVVIDPGHGGEDPGALGPAGTKEKTVVLSIAHKLCQALNQKPGYKAFLTREKDYFVPLRKRWQIAKEYDADLFISIHTNGSLNRNKQGAEIYCLSDSGASQEAARILASQENASDLIGGVDLVSCSNEVDSLIVSLSQTRTINDSLIFGRTALGELTKVTKINFSNPLQAGFAVLKAPDIPSVLVEVGYISHPREEKILVDGGFQGKIVQALTRGVVSFLSQVGGEIVADF